MILLAAVILGAFTAWRVRHLGVYLVLCDVLGILLAGTAAMAYTRWVAELIPWPHPLKATACMAGLFLIGWLAFRTVARSFSGDLAIDFDDRVEQIFAAVLAFGGTLTVVAVASTVVLTLGDLPEPVKALQEPLWQAASLGVAAWRFVAFFAGGGEDITLKTILEQALAAI